MLFLIPVDPCSSPTRMLVPQHMLKDATEIAVNAAEAMLTGDPNSEENFLGPDI